MLIALPAGLALEITIFPILFIALKIGNGAIEFLQNSIKSNLSQSSVARKVVQVKKKYTKNRNSNFVAITIFSIFALC